MGHATDTMLDLWLAGISSDEIADRIGKDESAIEKRIREFIHNTLDRAKNYEPVRRISRTGLRITKNEKWLIQEHRARGVSLAVTSKVTARNANEIMPDLKGEIQLNSAKTLSNDLDLLWAHSYVLHCCRIQIISKQAYEQAKKEQIEFGDGGPIVCSPGFQSSQCHHYPHHIRSLGFYILFKFMEKTGEWNYDVLPPGFFAYLKDKVKSKHARFGDVEESEGSQMSFDERDLE